MHHNDLMAIYASALKLYRDGRDIKNPRLQHDITTEAEAIMTIVDRYRTPAAIDRGQPD